MTRIKRAQTYGSIDDITIEDGKTIRIRSGRDSSRGRRKLITNVGIAAVFAVGCLVAVSFMNGTQDSGNNPAIDAENTETMTEMVLSRAGGYSSGEKEFATLQSSLFGKVAHPTGDSDDSERKKKVKTDFPTMPPSMPKKSKHAKEYHIPTPMHKHKNGTKIPSLKPTEAGAVPPPPNTPGVPTLAPTVAVPPNPAAPAAPVAPAAPGAPAAPAAPGAPPAAPGAPGAPPAPPAQPAAPTLLEDIQADALSSVLFWKKYVSPSGPGEANPLASPPPPTAPPTLPPTPQPTPPPTLPPTPYPTPVPTLKPTKPPTTAQPTASPIHKHEENHHRHNRSHGHHNSSNLQPISSQSDQSAGSPTVATPSPTSQPSGLGSVLYWKNGNTQNSPTIAPTPMPTLLPTLNPVTNTLLRSNAGWGKSVDSDPAAQGGPELLDDSSVLAKSTMRRVDHTLERIENQVKRAFGHRE
eukprot:CAMPEP_0184487094 /NCGR_PEP_ID=MMETSP0113_2-20130426/9200_1 /TAXON_ID=91329 /ORGANISM="Norrisiella sphaerica, Strain BC52" /LENGTH=465 /DNA_ID=CAMNT_0026869267 /DNA_START=206 /DNA_END=1603 /DNA_ORIENTATION=-